MLCLFHFLSLVSDMVHVSCRELSFCCSISIHTDREARLISWFTMVTIIFRENYVVLSIFYSEVQMEVVQQDPAYGFFRLVGKLNVQYYKHK